jgi:hypothetical protein
VVNRCKICNANAKAVDKALVTPIVSKGPGHRIVIDLMDFRANIDTGSAWVGHIRCPFSCKSWLEALPNKEALTVAGMFENWLRFNGRGSVYRV